MTITLNGKAYETQSSTLPDLLAELGMTGKPIVIEHNTNALTLEQHAETPLANGDRLELVLITAGG